MRWQIVSACRRGATAWLGLPSCRWLWPVPARARASSGAALMSRAMASVRLC